ncbi:hypothetical protein [Streptomyces griseoviridis]
MLESLMDEISALCWIEWDQEVLLMVVTCSPVVSVEPEQPVV